MATAVNQGGFTTAVFTPTLRATVNVTAAPANQTNTLEYTCPVNTIAFIKFCGDVIGSGGGSTHNYLFGCDAANNPHGGAHVTTGVGVGLQTPDPTDFGQFPTVPAAIGDQGTFGVNYYAYNTSLQANCKGWFMLLPGQTFRYTASGMGPATSYTFRYEKVQFTGV